MIGPENLKTEPSHLPLSNNCPSDILQFKHMFVSHLPGTLLDTGIQQSTRQASAFTELSADYSSRQYVTPSVRQGISEVLQIRRRQTVARRPNLSALASINHALLKQPVHSFMYCLSLPQCYNLRAEQLLQKEHGLQSLKYFLSGPVPKDCQHLL